MMKSRTRLAHWDIDRQSWRRPTSVLDIAITIAVLLAIVYFVNSCRSAFAQDRQPGDPCFTHLQGPKRKTLAWDDVPGIWFRMDIARCILGDLRTIPKYQERIKLLDEKLTLQTEQLALEVEARQIATQEADIATGNLEAAVRLQRQAEADRDHWTRSRLLWASVGATTVIVGIFVAGQL